MFLYLNFDGLFAHKGQRDIHKKGYTKLKILSHFSRCTGVLFLLEAMVFSISMTCFKRVKNNIIFGVNFFCLH